MYLVFKTNFIAKLIKIDMKLAVGSTYPIWCEKSFTVQQKY